MYSKRMYCTVYTLLAMVFQGVHHMFTSGLPPGVTLNGVFYTLPARDITTQCSMKMMLAEMINNRKLSYGKVQMQNW
jgi:hypothetical protein